MSLDKILGCCAHKKEIDIAGDSWILAHLLQRLSLPQEALGNRHPAESSSTGIYAGAKGVVEFTYPPGPEGPQRNSVKPCENTCPSCSFQGPVFVAAQRYVTRKY